MMAPPMAMGPIAVARDQPEIGSLATIAPRTARAAAAKATFLVTFMNSPLFGLAPHLTTAREGQSPAIRLPMAARLRDGLGWETVSQGFDLCYDEIVQPVYS